MPERDAGYRADMGGIYDETTVPIGEGLFFPMGEVQLHVNRTPTGEWMVDAGGTDVVTISAAEGGGYFVSAGAAPALRSAFPAAMQLALRRLGL